MGLLSILIGICMAYGSIYLLKREIKNGLNVMKKQYPGINDENTAVILSQFDRMESLVNDLNESYYEVTSDLEGKYSVHEKEISILENRIDSIEKDVRQLKSNFAVHKESDRKMIGKQSTDCVAESNIENEEKSIEVSQMPLELLNLSERDKIAYRRRVIELRQKGLNLSQIARELGVGVGELQLFLNLNKAK